MSQLDHPIQNLKRNMADVKRLLEIHTNVGGTGTGRRWGIDILNRSAVVFLAAAWEAFIEDAATQAIDYIILHSSDHKTIPLVIRKTISKNLKNDVHELSVWKLADSGWKDLVENYRDVIVKKEILPFNTPKPQHINALFKGLLDINNMSGNWNWRGMTVESANTKLRKFIETRGAIAHRSELPQSVTRAYVKGHRLFIGRLSVRTANVVRTQVHKIVGSYPWIPARLGNFR